MEQINFILIYMFYFCVCIWYPVTFHFGRGGFFKATLKLENLVIIIVVVTLEPSDEHERLARQSLRRPNSARSESISGNFSPNIKLL